MFGFTIFDIEGNENRHEEKQNMSVYSVEKGKWVRYRELNFREKEDFDRRYPYDGQTYEGFWGTHS